MTSGAIVTVATHVDVLEPREFASRVADSKRREAAAAAASATSAAATAGTAGATGNISGAGGAGGGASAQNAAQNAPPPAPSNLDSDAAIARALQMAEGHELPFGFSTETTGGPGSDSWDAAPGNKKKKKGKGGAAPPAAAATPTNVASAASATGAGGAAGAGSSPLRAADSAGPHSQPSHSHSHDQQHQHQHAENRGVPSSPAAAALAHDLCGRLFGSFFEFDDSSVRPMRLSTLGRAFEGGHVSLLCFFLSSLLFSSPFSVLCLSARSLPLVLLPLPLFLTAPALTPYPTPAHNPCPCPCPCP